MQSRAKSKGSHGASIMGPLDGAGPELSKVLYFLGQPPSWLYPNILFKILKNYQQEVFRGGVNGCL